MARSEPHTKARSEPRAKARRAWRYGLLGLAVLVVLVVGTVAVLIASFDPNSLKPRIEAAVKQATGRDLLLNGPIILKPSLWPTLEAKDVAFANPPGYSRAQMATLGALDLQLDVLPLLHHQFEITHLVLVHPDILLERDAQGRPNWRFPPARTAAPGPTAPPGASRPRTEITLRNVLIQDGTVAWRDDRSGKSASVALQQLTAQAAGPDAPLTLAVNATYNGVAFNLGGEFGPLIRLQQPDADTPWPVKLTLAAAGAVISLDGAMTHPLQGRGYTAKLDGSIRDLSALAPLLPGARLPPLHDVHFGADISDSGGPVPHIEAATLHLGPADLGAYVSGLHIVSADIDAPKQDQPVHLAAQISLADTPITLAATVGAASTLLPGQPPAPVPLDLQIHAADAQLNVKGALAHPETLSGADLALDATIPDLSKLSALAHRSLPPVTKIAFQGRLTDASGGFKHGAMLHDVKLTSAAGDLSGDIGVDEGPPPSLTGKLHADRIDANALQAEAPKPAPTSPAGNTNAPPPATRAPQAAAPPPQNPTGAWRLFPDTPIPFGLLHQANSDLALSVGDLQTGGSHYRAINFHLLLQDGKLRLAPFSADLPEGRLDGDLSIDAGNAAAPPITLTLHAPGLEVAPLLAAAGLPGYVSGRLGIYADLHSAGDSPHAIAAGLDGTLGLAMQNGTVDTQLLEQAFGPVLHRASLPVLLAQRGATELRCFALRANVQRGVADLRTLVLNSSALSMDGSGTINLGDETLALQLRPEGRLGGTVFVVPLRVTGPFRSPEAKVNAIGAAESDVGAAAGAVGKATPLGALGNLLGVGKLLEPAAPEACAGPLAVARGEAPPAPAAAKPSGPGALLHDLLR